jgi:hypothetical protein
MCRAAASLIDSEALPPMIFVTIGDVRSDIVISGIAKNGHICSQQIVGILWHFQIARCKPSRTIGVSEKTRRVQKSTSFAIVTGRE